MPNITDRISANDLEKLRNRQVSTTNLAKEYGVSLPYLSRALAEAGFEKEPSHNAAVRVPIHKQFQTRKELRQDLAVRVEANMLTMEEAAQLGKCSERTIFRYRRKANEV